MLFYDVNFTGEFILIRNFILNIMYVISTSNLFEHRRDYLVAEPFFRSVYNSHI